MDHDEHVLQIATERFERRLAEECGKLHVQIANVHTAISALRGETIDRNHDLLKWALLFWATGIAAVAAVIALFR
jgi:hypothetical protein